MNGLLVRCGLVSAHIFLLQIQLPRPRACPRHTRRHSSDTEAEPHTQYITQDTRIPPLMENFQIKYKSKHLYFIESL